MTEKEKKALEYLEGMLTIYKDIPAPISQKGLEIIYNLVKKQQKEIEDLKERYKYVNDANFRVNSTLLELAENSISKDKIREIIEKSFPDVAVQKLIELLGEE